MNILCNLHRDFLIKLIKEEVKFILVGGYATIFHGYVRMTGDLDIWLEPTNTNKERVVKILEDLNFSKDSIKSLQKTDFTQMVAFHFGDPPEKIDFLTKLSGIFFENASERCKYLPLDEFRVPVLSLEDLILTKMLSNRAKDKADIEELQKIYRMKS